MNSNMTISRRCFLQSAAGVAAMLAGMPAGLAVEKKAELPAAVTSGRNPNLFSDLLKTWCDGLVARQVVQPDVPARHGAIVCPGCSHLHGRCADALYPLMHMARVSGDKKYLDAAVLVQAWSDNVSQADGSWLNEVSGSTWKGITVFGSIALAEALHYHGDLLEAKIRERWRTRLAAAVKFLDGFMTMTAGNINYPVTSSLAFAAAGRTLDNPHYLDRGREFAHASLDYFTKNNFLFGEGKPQTATTPKGARPVDLGYNVEESLPALALYGLLAKDKDVIDRTVSALRTHMEFMLPDGGWDNSWGSRNYKWTWWGSRTSDGCQPAYALLAAEDPGFREIAWRSTEQMAACTHDGLLYGGPHNHGRGEKPCVHHTFTHAKALATVLDHGEGAKPGKTELPREKAYGLKTFPEIGTTLVAVGPWRATVTDYDWEYTVGGQPSGGTLSLLYHLDLGPVLSASMTEYRLVEEHNQQKHGDAPSLCLSPRLEFKEADKVCTSLNDLEAELKSEPTDAGVTVTATGDLETVKHEAPGAGKVRYRFVYRFTPDSVKISVSILSGEVKGVRLIVPVVSSRDEGCQVSDVKSVCFKKPGGLLVARTDAADGFEKVTGERVFNLVPGFECIPLAVAVPSAGKEVSVEFKKS